MAVEAPLGEKGQKRSPLEEHGLAPLCREGGAQAGDVLHHPEAQIKALIGLAKSTLGLNGQLTGPIHDYKQDVAKLGLLF